MGTAVLRGGIAMERESAGAPSPVPEGANGIHIGVACHVFGNWSTDSEVVVGAGENPANPAAYTTIVVASIQSGKELS